MSFSNDSQDFPNLRYGSATLVEIDFTTIHADGVELNPVITLGHELVHAWRHQTRQAISEGIPQIPYLNSWLKSFEEIETVGDIVPYNAVGRAGPIFTENILRRYLGMQQRLSYTGVNFQGFLTQGLTLSRQRFAHRVLNGGQPEAGFGIYEAAVLTTLMFSVPLLPVF